MRLISRKKTETLEIDGFAAPVRLRAGHILANVLDFNFDRFINYPSANFRRHVERVLRELWNDCLAVSPLFLCLIWKYIDDTYLLGDEKGIWEHCPAPMKNAGFPSKAFAEFFNKYSTVKDMESINLQMFDLTFNQCMARLQIIQAHFRQAADVCLNENNKDFLGTGYTAPQRYALYSQFYGDDNALIVAKNYGWCKVEQSDLICEKKKTAVINDEDSGKIVVERFSEFVRLSEMPEVKIAICHTVDNIIGLCCAQFSQLVRNDMALALPQWQEVQQSAAQPQNIIQFPEPEEAGIEGKASRITAFTKRAPASAYFCPASGCLQGWLECHVPQVEYG